MADYGKGMYRQLVEQTEKAERLEKENHRLHGENAALRKKVERLEERVDSMTAELDARIEAAVSKAATPLCKEIMHKQKVPGCYRSWQGLLDYCKIRSLTDTTRKRGGDVLAAIRSCFSPPLPAEL